MSDTKTEMATTEVIIRRAIADPVVPRGDNYAEPLISWQARSVLAALEANGLTITDRAAAESLARIAAVRELHKPIDIPNYSVPMCEACGDCCMVPWPCLTIRALDGQDPQEADRA